MNHRFIVVASLLCAFVFSSLMHLGSAEAHDESSWRGLKGSGTVSRESRSLPAFEHIDLRDSTDLIVTIGATPSLTVEADDNLLSHIVTTVDGNELIVSSEGDYSSRHNPKIIITLPNLAALAIHGSGDAQLRGLSGERLKLSIDGSGDIDASGQVDAVELRINGSGDADLSAVKTRSTTVAINGSGDAQVDATESLSAVVNGSGDISYSGHPTKVQKRSNGSGDILAR